MGLQIVTALYWPPFISGYSRFWEIQKPDDSELKQAFKISSKLKQAWRRILAQMDCFTKNRLDTIHSWDMNLEMNTHNSYSGRHFQFLTNYSTIFLKHTTWVSYPRWGEILVQSKAKDSAQPRICPLLYVLCKHMKRKARHVTFLVHTPLPLMPSILRTVQTVLNINAQNHRGRTTRTYSVKPCPG